MVFWILLTGKSFFFNREIILLSSPTVAITVVFQASDVPGVFVFSWFVPSKCLASCLSLMGLLTSFPCRNLFGPYVESSSEKNPNVTLRSTSRPVICWISHGVMKDHNSPGHKTVSQTFVPSFVSHQHWVWVYKYGCNSWLIHATCVKTPDSKLKVSDVGVILTLPLPQTSCCVFKAQKASTEVSVPQMQHKGWISIECFTVWWQ